MTDKKTNPFVSIVVPSRNAASTLSACLESLNSLNYPTNRREILIVDGMSTDETKDIAKAFGARVIENPKESIVTGRNLGFLAAKGELIAYSDADCVMEENWLSNSLKYFQVDEAIAGVTGPIQTPPNQNAFAKAVAFLFSLSVSLAGSTHKETRKAVQDVEDFPTCNAIYRKAALKTVMPLDEKLFSGSDVELNYRLRGQGYRLLSTPDVVVWHYKRETPRGFFRQMYRYAIGRLQIGKKWPGILNGAHVAVGLSLPLFIILSVYSFVVNPRLFSFLIGLALMLLLLLCLFAFFKTRALKTTLCLPMAFAILITGWSIGFCRELIFPIRGPQAN